MTPSTVHSLSKKILPALLLFSLLAGTVASATEPLVIDDFESGTTSRWEPKTFQGRTDYQVVTDDDGLVLRARSRGAASGLVRKIEFDPREYPVLSWRWKVDGIVPGGDARAKTGDDYAARVYVVFPHWFPPKTRSLNYIWANRLPVGTFVPNPYFGRAVMVAVESGDSRAGRWVVERRNLVDDYRKAFGADPPKAGAIAIMTDTDQTGASAVGWYDDLRLEPAVTAHPAPGTGSGPASR